MTKWIVAFFWIVVFVGSGAFAGKLADVQDNQASSWLPGNAESTQALEKLAGVPGPQRDPDASSSTRATTGLTPANIAEIEGRRERDRQAVDGVTGKVVGPIPSKDGAGDADAGHVQLRQGRLEQACPTSPTRCARLAAVDGHDGAHRRARAARRPTPRRRSPGIDGILLFATCCVVIVILLFTYRSPVLLVPAGGLGAGVALIVAQAVVYFLAKDAGLTVNGQSQGILTVLVFGAGTDYALLLVARYREELRRHEDRHEAMAFALHRAGPGDHRQRRHRRARACCACCSPT